MRTANGESVLSGVMRVFEACDVGHPDSPALRYAFATHPDQWQRLRTEPHLARVAFDEAVRWESPVQTFFRPATSDIRIARDPSGRVGFGMGLHQRVADTAPQQHPARVGISYRAG
ncbi:hypothetical protein F4560_002622 [Saccharothrix ecbatanensis]|uniref:Uncharacterized protein n=1 Tax=Saccharothrix ecbatanensis TaxID=1105145 RepID=A0A7W9HJA0_9PSEU|nr:hypothetical protein [Saccharothrix ecbatanensis]MBB5802854.1 hypothetical protein [Saccharothrix ecbatanensis]